MDENTAGKTIKGKDFNHYLQLFRRTDSASAKKSAWQSAFSLIETFEQAQRLYGQEYPIPERAKVMTLALNKAETLEQCFWLWREMSLMGHLNTCSAWEKTKKIAQDFDHSYVLLNLIISFNYECTRRTGSLNIDSEIIEVWEITQKMAETFEQIWALREKTEYNPKKQEFWNLAQKKARAFEHYQELYRDADSKTMIWILARSKAKTFEHAQWLLNEAPNEYAIADAWDFAKGMADSFEHYQWLFENTEEKEHRKEMWVKMQECARQPNQEEI